MNTKQATAARDYDLNYKASADNRALDHIPGNYGLPLIGHSLRATWNLLNFLIEDSTKHGLVFRTQLGAQRSVIALGADVNQQVFLDRSRHFSSEKGYEYSMSPFFGGGLMLRDFDEHRMHRRIMQTAFKTEVLKTYMGYMNASLGRHIRQWRNKDPFIFYDSIRPALLAVGAEIFIGVSEDDPDLGPLNQNFLDAVSGLNSLVHVNLPGFNYYRGLRGRKRLHRYFRKLLPTKRKEQPNDMFAYFAQERDESGELFSDNDVIQHISFLLMAAHDTTTSALSNCMAALVTYPEWQNRLREESRALGKDTLEHEDLEQLESLNLFMQEVLRLHGPVPLIMRRTTADLSLDKLHVPAHTILTLAPCYTHHMKEWWDEPKRFDPERFNAQRAEHKRHNFCYIPFGGGAHKCIGMHFAMLQIRCFLHQFVLNYEARLPENYKMPIQFQDVPFPHPQDGLPLILKAVG
jgi:cytochrome P450